MRSQDIHCHPDNVEEKARNWREIKSEKLKELGTKNTSLKH